MRGSIIAGRVYLEFEPLLDLSFRVTVEAIRWTILLQILIWPQEIFNKVSFLAVLTFNQFQACYEKSTINKYFFYSSEDFWFDLFDAPYIKYFILFISILTLIFVIPLFLIIFLHIQDKRFRTVLTYGENMVYLYPCFYMCVPFTLDVIRIFSGPMPETICWLTIFFKNFGVFGGQFGFIVCIMLRYFYIIVYKSVGVFHDDFCGLYFHLISAFLASVASFVNSYVPGKMGLNYYICTGEDPEPYSYLGKKVFDHLGCP